MNDRAHATMAGSCRRCTTNCSLAQLDTRKLAKFSVVVIVTGVPSRGPQRDGEQADRVARSEVRQRARVRRGRCGFQPSADVALLARAASVRTHRVLLLGLVRRVPGLRRSHDSRKAKRRARAAARAHPAAGGDAQRRRRARRQDSSGPRRRHAAQAIEEAARQQADALARHARRSVAGASSQGVPQGDRALPRRERPADGALAPDRRRGRGLPRSARR